MIQKVEVVTMNKKDSKAQFDDLKQRIERRSLDNKNAIVDIALKRTLVHYMANDTAF